MKVTTAAEMNAIDRRTSERYGVASLTLMENAGTAAADFALAHWPHASRVAVVCGRGNNGGDGLVLARHLHQAGKVVEVLLLGAARGLKPDAAAMLARLPLRVTEIVDLPQMAQEAAHALAEAELIVDAIFGTGYRPRPQTSPTNGAPAFTASASFGTLAAAAIRAINAVTAPVLALDLPSGCDADQTNSEMSEEFCRASATITFTAPKPAHVFVAFSRGPLAVAAIGTPPEAIASAENLYAIPPQTVASLFVARALESNKGRYGHVLIVGGSLGKSGAAAMAGMAALRVGAGLATVAAPAAVRSEVAAHASELMTELLGFDGAESVEASAAAHCLELAKSRTVLAVGPGLGQRRGVAEFVQRLVKAAPAPLVLDADGLNAFVGATNLLDAHARPLVLTPHPGEMARLLGTSVAEVQAARPAVAREFARRHRLILVLKGSRTIVAYPSGELWVNATGNPGLATGGTGDILTGLIAGAMAQFPARLDEAVRAAVYLHGLAADLAVAELGEESLLATDLLRYLPQAFDEARRRAAAKVVRLR